MKKSSELCGLSIGHESFVGRFFFHPVGFLCERKRFAAVVSPPPQYNYTYIYIWTDLAIHKLLYRCILRDRIWRHTQNMKIQQTVQIHTTNSNIPRYSRLNLKCNKVQEKQNIKHIDVSTYNKQTLEIHQLFNQLNWSHVISYDMRSQSHFTYALYHNSPLWYHMNSYQICFYHKYSFHTGPEACHRERFGPLGGEDREWTKPWRPKYAKNVTPIAMSSLWIFVEANKN